MFHPIFYRHHIVGTRATSCSGAPLRPSNRGVDPRIATPRRHLFHDDNGNSVCGKIAHGDQFAFAV